MIPAGLSSAQLKAFQDTLLTHHEIDVKVTIQQLDGTTVSDVSGMLTDGQVNVDASTLTLTRSATITLFDPHRSLPFDSDAPTDAALFLDRMIHITYGVLVAGTWIRVPVFTGPVTKLDRADVAVNVEAQGKEALSLGACWSPITLAKGWRKTDAIIRLMQVRSGETAFAIPTLPYTLPTALSLVRSSRPWDFAQAMSRSMNRHLFYDGAGVLRMRTIPATPTYTFTDQPGGNLLSRPQISYSVSDTLANIVQAIGATPTGSRYPYSYTAVAPASHPLSPQRLGRNGVPRYLLQTIQDDSLRSTAECAALARSTLNTSLLEAVSVSFDCLPVPHLEPRDVCQLSGSAGSTPFVLQKFSLPLVAGPPMTVGYTKNLAVRPRKVNR